MPSHSGDTLIRMTACEVLARLNAGDVTHTEVLDALEARVTAVDGAVNALPTLLLRPRAEPSGGDRLVAGDETRGARWPAGCRSRI